MRGRASGREHGLLRRHPDFRWFWGGQTISVFGSQVTAVALPLVAALTLDAGPGGVSAVATASFLPNLALPLLAGAWLERRPKKPAMIVADVVRAAALALVPVGYACGFLSLPLLAGVALVVGAASVLFDIGSFAFVPSLVEGSDLAAANRAMQGSATAAQVGGPGLAGVLVQAAGPAAAIAVDAVSYLASVTGLRAVRRQEEVAVADGVRLGIASGLTWIWRNPFLKALASHAAIYNCASQILLVNLVVYAIHERGLSAGLYGLALSAGGLGAFAGTLIALRLARALGYGRAFVGCLALSTGAPLLIAPAPTGRTAFAVSLAAIYLVSGVGLGSANVLSLTLRQIVTPIGSLARTNGGYRLLIFGVIPIGSMLGGVIGHAAGPRAGVATGAAGLVVSALPMAQRGVRRLRSPEGAAAPVALEAAA